MKKIKCTLGTLDVAIKELQAYKADIERKSKELAKRVGELIAKEAQQGFNSAIVDDLTPKSGGARLANVSVTVTEKGGMTVVVASGEDSIFAEFGAGVYHGGAIGSSSHPKGQELGFTIGSYPGQTNAHKNIWGFYENGELKLTRGAPTSKPLHTSFIKVIDEVPKLAKEIFSR